MGRGWNPALQRKSPSLRFESEQLQTPSLCQNDHSGRLRHLCTERGFECGGKRGLHWPTAAHPRCTKGGLCGDPAFQVKPPKAPARLRKAQMTPPNRAPKPVSHRHQISQLLTYPMPQPRKGNPPLERTALPPRNATPSPFYHWASENLPFPASESEPSNLKQMRSGPSHLIRRSIWALLPTLFLFFRFTTWAESTPEQTVAARLQSWSDDKTTVSLVIYRTNHVRPESIKDPIISTIRFQRTAAGFSLVEWPGYHNKPNTLHLTNSTLIVGSIGTNFWALTPKTGVLYLKDNINTIPYDEKGDPELQLLRNWYAFSRETIDGCSPYVVWSNAPRLGIAGTVDGPTFCCGTATISQTLLSPSKWQISVALETKPGKWVTDIEQTTPTTLAFFYHHESETRSATLKTLPLLTSSGTEIPSDDNLLIPGQLTNLFTIIRDLNTSTPRYIDPSGAQLTVANHAGFDSGNPIVPAIFALSSILSIITFANFFSKWRKNRPSRAKSTK